MTLKRLFVLNAAIAAGYGIVLLVAAGPILDVYGIDPNPEAVYMARWFGLELLALGLITWLARDAAESAGGRAVAGALAVTYGIGVVLALWGTLFGPFNALGWIAVSLNLLLGAGFGYVQLRSPRTEVTTGSS
jgi:Na+-driven multidrug efflux pump